MGREARCVASYAGASGEADVRLETDHVLVRGPFRLKAVLTELVGVEVDADRLILRLLGGTLALHLGVNARRWADLIRNPKTRVAKLGITNGTVVALRGIDDPEFGAEIVAAGAKVRESMGPCAVDIALLGADSEAELNRVRPWAKRLRGREAIWIVSRKGRTAGLKDIQVFLQTLKTPAKN